MGPFYPPDYLPEGFWPEGFLPETLSGADAPTNDGSMASLVEQWICDRIKTIGAFAESLVEPFRGSTSPEGEKLVAEMTANRSPYVCVLFEGDADVPLEEGINAYDPTYGIYITVANSRPAGEARRGDATTPGTNGLRDLVRLELHDRFPNIEVNGFHTERCRFRGVRIVFQRRDAFIARAEVTVREVPV